MTICIHYGASEANLFKDANRTNAEYYKTWVKLSLIKACVTVSSCLKATTAEMDRHGTSVFSPDHLTQRPR